MSASREDLDETIHAPRRLAICAFLAAVDEAEFSKLRGALGMSDSVLSKHLSILVAAQYVTLRKALSGGKIRTWVRLTMAGHTAFDNYKVQLRELLGLS